MQSIESAPRRAQADIDVRARAQRSQRVAADQPPAVARCGGGLATAVARARRRLDRDAASLAVRSPEGAPAGASLVLVAAALAGCGDQTSISGGRPRARATILTVYTLVPHEGRAGADLVAARSSRCPQAGGRVGAAHGPVRQPRLEPTRTRGDRRRGARARPRHRARSPSSATSTRAPRGSPPRCSTRRAAARLARRGRTAFAAARRAGGRSSRSAPTTDRRRTRSSPSAAGPVRRRGRAGRRARSPTRVRAEAGRTVRHASARAPSSTRATTSSTRSGAVAGVLRENPRATVVVPAALERDRATLAESRGSVARRSRPGAGRRRSATRLRAPTARPRRDRDAARPRGDERGARGARRAGRPGPGSRAGE